MLNGVDRLLERHSASESGKDLVAGPDTGTCRGGEGGH